MSIDHYLLRYPLHSRLHSPLHYLSHYLSHYAEPESRAPKLEELTPATYHFSLVIPAFKESSEFLHSLENIHSSGKFLLILVINQPEDVYTCPDNKKLLADIERHYKSCWKTVSSAALMLFEGNAFDILCVDRFSAGARLARKHGVGLARKIGADIACRLIYQRCIRSAWIFSSDADAQLPADYFMVTNEQTAAALIYPFRHTPDKGDSLPLSYQLYEKHLNYYVNGLRWAGSPYAFHSIGSCIAVHHRHYAQVRGFPKKAGGEDFYLLNKIRKTGPVKSLVHPVIELHARTSDRVPFGTGPATAKIAAMSKPLEEYLFYHPLCFHYLKVWLGAASDIWPSVSHSNGPDDFSLTNHLRKHCQPEPGNEACLDPIILEESLNSLEISKALQHCFSHSKDADTFSQHLMQWFDGFRTLKLIHHLRDAHFSSLTWQQVNSNRLMLWSDTFTNSPE